ncbi:acyl-CoA N-acyltransferase, partial [Panus rudis PR-1116 ss-1]
LGFIYLTPAAFPGSLNLGVIVSPNYRRQGYATQAIRLVLNFAFHELNCHRVEVRIADNNKRHRSSTVRLFASIGFEREAYSRCALFEPSGEWRDVITMSMLDTSWAYFSRAPVLSIVEIRRRWDDMFSRHDSERDELLALE